MKVVARISLDVSKAGVQHTIYLNSGDALSRELVVTLNNNGSKVEIPPDATAAYYAVVNGSTIYSQCDICDNAIFHIFKTSELVAGQEYEANIRIQQGSTVLFSPKFKVVAAECINDDNAVESSDEFSALTKVTSEAFEATQKAVSIANEVQEKLSGGEFKGAKGDPGAKGEPGEQGPKGDKGEQGEPGTTDYTDLENLPSINGEIITGALNANDLHIGNDLDVNDAVIVIHDGDEAIPITLAELGNLLKNTRNTVFDLLKEKAAITESSKTYTGNAVGTSKTTYYGFATRIHTPEKISGVRVYTMVTADADITCQLLSADRTTVYAEIVKHVPQSDVPSFVDFVFDEVADIAEDNIYVAVKAGSKCITQAMTTNSNVNTDLVSADDTDTTGLTNNCFISGGVWSPVKSTSNRYSFTMQFAVLATETSYSARVDLSEYALPKMNYIYVSPSGSDETGDGSELKPFATIWHANEVITDNNELNRYTIKVANGTYTDLQERFAGDTETLGAFQGIRTKNYVYYEGNINNPSACVIEWNGAEGFDLETYTNDLAVDKCPFHVVGSYAEGAMHTSIKGFKIVGKNLRYAMHCETAGYGYDVDYEVSNMILEWYGRPDVIDNTNEIPAIGTGSSPFERAYFHDIRIDCRSAKHNGAEYKFGFQNHDNANKYNISPAVMTGTYYRIENVNFGNSRFQLRNLTDKPAETFDICEMKNCVGITTAQKTIGSVAEKSNWKTDVKMCDIADNQL